MRSRRVCAVVKAAVEKLESRVLLSGTGLLDAVYHGNNAYTTENPPLSLPNPDPNGALNDGVLGGDNAAVSRASAWAAANTPNYTFTNTNDAFVYSGDSVAIVGTFLNNGVAPSSGQEGDAAGSALTDPANVSDTIFDAKGFFLTPVADDVGTYTVKLWAADDALAVYIGGNGTPGSGTLVASTGYNGANAGTTNFQIALPAGPNTGAQASIPIEILYFNGYGGAHISGVSGSSPATGVQILDPGNRQITTYNLTATNEPLAYLTPAVTGLTASRTGSSTVQLSFMAPSGANSFIISRSTSLGGTQTTLTPAGGQSATTFTDTSAPTIGNKDYYYSVTDVNSYGSSTPVTVFVGHGDGWAADYYSSSIVDPNGTGDSKPLTGDVSTAVLSFERIDPTISVLNDPPSGFNAIQPNPNNDFAVRWVGYVEAPVSGYYSFSVEADDKEQITFFDPNHLTNGNPTPVNISPAGHTMTGYGDNYTVPVVDTNGNPEAFTAGQKYLVQIDYNQGYGGLAANLAWAASSTASNANSEDFDVMSSETVPTDDVVAPTPGFTTVDASGAVSKDQGYYTFTATGNNGSVILYWDNIAADSYSIYRSTSGNGPFALINSSPIGASSDGSPVSYVDSNVTAGTTYYYILTGVGVSGETAVTLSTGVTSGLTASATAKASVAVAPTQPVNIINHHGDAANDGQNLTETVLTASNVNPTDFGLQYSSALDGAVINAEPLYVQNMNITTGASAGVHSVVYVATEADGLYALDANTGAVLWHDNFTNTTDPTNLTPTPGVGPILSTDINNSDVGSMVGILATPAIDLNTGEMFVTTNTREVRGNDTHFVQRLWAVSLSSGASTMAPAVIGDTIADSGIGGNFTYVSGPIISGTGNNSPTAPDTDRWTSNPGGGTGHVIAFNAILQMERPAVTLVNGQLYLAFASHGDDGPYYGWVLGYSESNLSLTAVFNDEPTYDTNVQSSQPYYAEAGFWMSGAAIATDGTYLYLTSGNGNFNGSPSDFNAQGFPIDGDYGDTLLKLAIDPTSTPSNPNINGWGLKVADYFTPSNQYELNALDLDLGSAGVTLLPSNLLDAAGNPMLVIGGKESRIYLIDRNNLGKFNTSYPETSTTVDPRLYDHVLGEYPNNGTDQGNMQIYSSAAYFNGNFYMGVHGSAGLEFNLATFASGTNPPGNTYTPTPVAVTSFIYGYPGTTFQVSANGSTNGVVWAGDPSGVLLAYDAGSFVNAIYSTNTNPADLVPGGIVHFSLPTIANGMAYVGTNSGNLVGYGLDLSYLDSSGSYFSAPSSLTATVVSPGDVRLNWVDNSSLATEFRIDRAAVGSSSWSTLAYVGNPNNTYYDTSAGTNLWRYRVVGISGPHSTASSNTAALTSTALSNNGASNTNVTQALSFAATVTSGVPDGETVTLEDASNGNAVVATGLVSGGVANLNVPGGILSAGAHDLFAVYAGDANFTASQSATITQNIVQLAVPSGSTLDINLSAAGPVTLSGTGNTITASQNGVLVSLSGFSGITVIDTGSNDVLNFDGPIGLPFSFVSAGTSVVNVNSGTLTFATPAGGSINLGGLSIASAAGAAMTAVTQIQTVLNLGSLSIAGAGSLDVTNNEVIVAWDSNHPVSVITGLLHTGYNGGGWNGSGIMSSTAAVNKAYALGYANGADGIVVNLGSRQVEIKYTLYGDLNLDGVVNGTDFGLLAAQFGKVASNWDQGELNYDGVVNGSDFALLAANFGKSDAVAAVETPTVTTKATSMLISVPVKATSLVAVHKGRRRHGRGGV
jgi:hypothetical protein